MGIGHPQLLAIAFYGVACFVSLCGWGLLRLNGRVACLGALVLGGGVAALPALFPVDDVGLKSALVLCCVFQLKLWDAWVDREAWRGRSLREWMTCALNPVALVYRCHVSLPRPTRWESARRFVRGLLEVVAGIALFRWLNGLGAGAFPFWFDHALRLLASYLFIWDGGCVLFTASWRLLGLRCIEFSIHPILAVTPADFWRRYNRWLGEFLREDIFRLAGARRRPILAVLVCFGAVGVQHEYLAWVLTGRFTWHLPLFFLLHGVATAATFRLRPSGLNAVGCRVGTLLFLYGTSMLFFARFGEIVPGWYPS